MNKLEVFFSCVLKEPVLGLVALNSITPHLRPAVREQQDAWEKRAPLLRAAPLGRSEGGSFGSESCGDISLGWFIISCRIFIKVASKMLTRPSQESGSPPTT